MVKNPLLSVHILTYKHENYLKYALEGVLNQKTNFEYEILICDDCSPDSTPEIVDFYLYNHPSGNKIKYFRHERNIGMIQNSIFVTENSLGKYIAICEGDDYWIDVHKLQKQIDFLESNSDHSICFHPVIFQDTNLPENSVIKKPKNKVFAPEVKDIYSTSDIILGGGGLIATNSMVIRNIYKKEFNEWIQIAKVGDLPMMLTLSLKGKIGYLDDIMSVYRISIPGSWTDKYNESLFQRFNTNKSLIKFWLIFNRYTAFKFSFYIVFAILKIYLSNLKFLLLRILHLIQKPNFYKKY